MSLEEYFGDWTRIIDRTELNKVMNVLNVEYNKFNVFITLFNSVLSITLIQSPKYSSKDINNYLEFSLASSLITLSTTHFIAISRRLS